MSRVKRQDSYGSLDSYLCDDGDDLLEALTLSSKELQQAREQALKILETESPEEALKIFTQVSHVKSGNPLGEKVGAAGAAPKPLKAADGKASATVPPPPPKS